MSVVPKQRKSLLSSYALVQAPWIRVSIGNFTFGVFNRAEANKKDNNGFYTANFTQYPNYVQSLNIVKINGQVNQYTLQLVYPVRSGDDPNFFDKVISSVSDTRKIVFSYGDSATPAYCYKDEEAIITKIGSTPDPVNSRISYSISAISGSALLSSGCYTFVNSGLKKPSDEIKRIFRNSAYGLRNIFTGMSDKNLDALVDGSDKAVKLETKTNISALEYISYLVGCMIPSGSATDNRSKDIYILTIHDETVYDELYNDSEILGGAYFKVKRTSYTQSYSDAFEIDIGYNTNTLVLGFNIDHNENYSILYDYNKELQPEEYVSRLTDDGEWESTYSPAFTSKNVHYETRAEDISWYTKLTKYPIKATLKVQGLLRPAMLMQYIRLNVIFPGGRKHISSGLYIVTKQVDDISGSGYVTTLSLTKIEGDDNPTELNDEFYNS